MTTTVRILGSRAREQVPGTSIKLLAPGFRGSLTQESPAAMVTEPDLPFAEAAAGADVMPAGQLTMNIEARPPDDGPELRSRSAVAAYPRLIVPRRKGVAYALLQTDSRGFSRFVMPVSREGDEAIFTLTTRRAGPTRRTLRVFMWAASPVMGPGTHAVVSHWERQHRPHRLLQLGASGAWESPDNESLTRGPCLLLLHGCFGTPHSAFGEWLDHHSFSTLYAQYGGRCLAFAHPTLSVAIEENLRLLVASLPWLPTLDVVGHGRGGLLARALAADGRARVRRAVLVGTPNQGTPLAHERRVANFLDGHIGLLAWSRRNTALPVLEGALSLARCVALGLPVALPGLEQLAPESPLLAKLAAGESATRWFTIGARFTATDTDAIAPGLDEPGDFVVPADSCQLPTTQLTDCLRLSGSDAHHHGYFSSRAVREQLTAWLT